MNSLSVMYESIYSRIHHHCIMNPCMTQFGIHCDSIMNPLWPHYASRKKVHYESIVNIWIQHELCLNPLWIQCESIVWFPPESTMNPFWIQNIPLWIHCEPYEFTSELCVSPLWIHLWLRYGFIMASSWVGLAWIWDHILAGRIHPARSRWTNSSS